MSKRNQKPGETAASALEEQKELGGIDFTALPITLQSPLNQPLSS